MKVVYESILERIEDIKDKADREDRIIKHIVLNDSEMRQFEAEIKKIRLNSIYWFDCRKYYGVKVVLGEPNHDNDDNGTWR